MTLEQFFAENPETAIAFSGGVDSAYLLYAATRYAARVKAYYVSTVFQPAFELEDAQRVNIARRFCAMKLIEGEQDFFDALELSQNEKELIEHTIIEMEHETGLDRNAALADMRYNFIERDSSSTSEVMAVVR